MILFRAAFAACLLLFSYPAAAGQTAEREDLLSVFEDHSAVGTFVFSNAKTGDVVIVGADRARQRFIPASTFKIINSLIALEIGAIRNENEVVPYGGKPQRFKAWERDMSVREAIRLSNVPVFQELARRIGLQNYQNALNDYKFGNRIIGSDVETFWLSGPLKISALEYIDMLIALAHQRLPAGKENQHIVRDIVQLESRGSATLFGKTGWTTAPDPDIGWFVGWVERGDTTYAFALNMDIDHRHDAKKRVAITKILLGELGVW